MKRLLSLLLVLAMALTLAACAAGEEAAETTAPAEVTEAPAEEPTQATEATEAPTFRMPTEVIRTEFGPREEVEVPADAEKVLLGEDVILTQPVRGGTASPLDETRPCYGVGTCTTMTGHPFVLYLFVSDNESAWTEQEAINFTNNCLSPGVWWLEDQAAARGVELGFGAGWYYGSGDGFCHYDGDLLCADVGWNPDILEKVSVSMGFADKEEMYRLYREWTGCEDVMFVIIPNKPGRSYAVVDSTNDGADHVEHCVVFAWWCKDDQHNARGDAMCPSVAAHEILHCFGAEDYYADGTTRKALAEAYFPREIMLAVYADINYNTVCDYTAYTIGWTDVTPDLCYDPNWWS